MKISITQIKYFIKSIRTKKDYLVFQVGQLVLALAIITCALSNPNYFKAGYVLWMEFVLLLTMVIDLFLIRLISEGGFKQLTKGTMGKVDLAVFIMFSLTLVFLAINDDQQQDQLLQVDDIIIILIIVSRYAIQIYSMIVSIKKTHENREMNKQIKQIDLNVQQNISTIYQKDIQHQYQLQDKIAKKFQKRQVHRFVEQQNN